jgi:hypothetical protein
MLAKSPWWPVEAVADYEVLDQPPIGGKATGELRVAEPLLLDDFLASLVGKCLIDPGRALLKGSLRIRAVDVGDADELAATM